MNVYLRFRRNVAADAVKKRMKKKIVPPKLALPDSVANIKWLLVKVKNPDCMRSVRVL
jgi:hypothetical protein